MSKRAKKTLSDLTWAELEAWAGSRIVSRGKSYQKSGSVRDLARTSDGGLLAWVRGSRNYATKAALEKGRLSSDCTCPYEGPANTLSGLCGRFSALHPEWVSPTFSVAI